MFLYQMKKFQKEKKNGNLVKQIIIQDLFGNMLKQLVRHMKVR